MTAPAILSAEDFLSKLVASPTAKAVLKLLMTVAEDALHADSLAAVTEVALQALQAGLSGDVLVKLIEQAMTDASDAQMRLELGAQS